MSSASQKKWRLEHRHPCPDCGIPVEVRSVRCKSCALKKIRSGRGYNWKGGRRKEGGYILIWHPNHHRNTKSGYVQEHILIWEETQGKPLPDGWIVHHLNGIKNDNQPRNLVSLPSKKHYLVLQAKAKRIQELEAIINGQKQLL